MRKSSSWLLSPSLVAAGLGLGGAIAAARSAHAAARIRSLAGQVVVITGGSRGLGLALARRFVDLGCRVAICGRDERSLERARDELLARGGPHGAEVIAMPADVSDDVESDRFIELVFANWGRVDVLITCAATLQVGPIETMTTRDLHHAMESIFWSAAYPSLAVLPIMKHQGAGRIAHVTSIGGKIAIPHMVSYSAAKFAEVGFSEGLRAEVARHGIGVTTIVPGLMRTGSHVHAQIKGRARREYEWFGLSAASPAMSIDADRAARAIVRAIALGRDEVVLGAPARLAERVHALSPALARVALSLVGRMLPSAAGQSAAEPAVEGLDIEQREGDRALVKAVTRLGHHEAERFHQI